MGQWVGSLNLPARESGLWERRIPQPDDLWRFHFLIPPPRPPQPLLCLPGPLPAVETRSEGNSGTGG